MTNDDVFSALIAELLGVGVPKPKKENEMEEATKELYSQFTAFMEVGFTREEAYGLLITILEGAFNR